MGGEACQKQAVRVTMTWQSTAALRKRPKTIPKQGQPGVLDEPPASHRSTSLHSSLLPVRPSSHTPGSPQLILIRLFGQVRIIKIFLNIYCHSATFSASPKGSSLLLGHAGPAVASQLPLWSRRACVATNLG